MRVAAEAGEIERNAARGRGLYRPRAALYLLIAPRNGRFGIFDPFDPAAAPIVGLLQKHGNHVRVLLGARMSG
ncbi:hypothetical protein [Paraburkholderia flagellata]|uniref:hypothetical protein n=1 Tax=Paraburkholderia flagellata TaxID=2883241 RepID=UPI001F30D34A|nr:hypothetical protein [Paraburkholderia flagellata]